MPRGQGAGATGRSADVAKACFQDQASTKQSGHSSGPVFHSRSCHVFEQDRNCKPPYRLLTMTDMLGSLDIPRTQPCRREDGWRRSLDSGIGFKHDCDASIAQGGWEFRYLMPGLSMAITRMVPTTIIPRGHNSNGNLVFTAVLEGEVDIQQGGRSGRFESGYCTMYGLTGNNELKTVYQPGRPLRWVSFFLDRTRFHSLTGLCPQDLPADIRDFLADGIDLSHRNLPLSSTAGLILSQMTHCPYQDCFQHGFFNAKALEFICEILSTAISQQMDCTPEQLVSARDRSRLDQAMKLLRGNLESPVNIDQIARMAGLTRQRLQAGFHQVYGDSVARVRDRLRMAHALDRLRDSEDRIIDIALDTGYGHPASFSRAFRTTYGVSPQQMRAMSQFERATVGVAS
ncbi:helix-turn-helix domain-containing protein [Luteimonas sp. RIT-PG2_3]